MPFNHTVHPSSNTDIEKTMRVNLRRIREAQFHVRHDKLDRRGIHVLREGIPTRKLGTQTATFFPEV